MMIYTNDMWLHIIEIVDSIKLYKGNEDNMFYAEVYIKRYPLRPDLSSDYQDFSDISWEGIVEQVYTWITTHQTI